MFRQHTRIAGAYRVTFSAEAWKEIGRLSSTIFQALQEALEQLAQQSRAEASTDAAPTTFTFTVGSLIIQCERDDPSRTLVLQRVTPAPQDPGRGIR